MEEITYQCYASDGVLQVTAEVSRYGFTSPGTYEEWLAYAKEKAKRNGIKKIIVYSETQDKETGYCTKHKEYEGWVDPNDPENNTPKPRKWRRKAE